MACAHAEAVECGTLTLKLTSTTLIIVLKTVVVLTVITIVGDGNPASPHTPKPSA